MKLNSVQLVPIEEVKLNEDNPRYITDPQFRLLVESIKSFPEMLSLRPTIVNKQMIALGGNMRRRAVPVAMEELALAGDEESKRKYQLLAGGMPVVIAEDLTPEQEREFIIKDNVAFGQWDWESLANDWNSEQLADWGLNIPDWKPIEAPLEASEDTFDTTPPKRAITISGDLYELNSHRLHCGDSTSSDDVVKLMDGKKANLCFTSPPYWVGKDYEYQDNEQQIDDFIFDIATGMAYATGKREGRVVINTGTASINRIDRKRKVEILPLIDKWQGALREHGWLLRHLRIWAKRGQLPASISPRTDTIDQHNEYLGTFELDGESYIEKYGGSDDEFTQVGTFWNPGDEQRGQERIGTKWAQQGLWDDIHGEKSAKGKHTAAFPVELPARNILLYTKRKEIIYEPFGGAGTTMIAAEQLDRVAFLQEMDPKYCDVTVKRWVAWMKINQRPYRVTRNGKDITGESWLTED